MPDHEKVQILSQGVMSVAFLSFFGGVAQWIEQLDSNQLVVGSSPTSTATLQGYGLMVKHSSDKREIIGSNPVIPTKTNMQVQL